MLRVMTEVGGARGGGKPRGKHRGARAAAVAPQLVAAALLVALLLYSAHRFAHFSSGSSIEGAQLDAARDGGAAGADRSSLLAATAAAGAAAGARRSSWMAAAGLWVEEHHEQRLSAQASRYQHPTGCGLQPCAAKQQQRPPTLVIYVYAAGDGEEQRNLDYFLKHGVEEQPAWLTYRIVVASGPGVLPPISRPKLPRNAEYVETSRCSTGVFGILAAAAQQLAPALAAAQHIVVVGSAVRGPFMPPYTRQHMHWTDAFTSLLTRRTKMVGSALTCEGAPKGGDAAAEWRLNPFLLPYAWATDKEGWQVLAASEEVMQCYGNTWDARYYADAGAALALLGAGYNIDTLLTKLQGVDWWNQRTWDCNQRVRPDSEWTYDGVSITPYETVFVPFSQGALQSEASFVRQAAKYGAWLDAAAVGAPQGNSNAFVSQQWQLRAQRMIYINARGPGCFDFEYYVQHNPDLGPKAGQHQQLWEHFVLLGQFQSRPHRFTCAVQVGNSYRSAYVRARGRRCFDHNHYSKSNQDLRWAGINQAYELFSHYADFGQFEQREARWTCSDSLVGLPAGFDTRPLDSLPLDWDQKVALKWKGLVRNAAAEAEAGLARMQQRPGAAGQQLQAAGAGVGAATVLSDQELAQRQAAALAASAANAAVQQAAAAANAAVQQAAAARATAALQEQQEAAAAAGAGGQQQQQQQQLVGEQELAQTLQQGAAEQGGGSVDADAAALAGVEGGGGGATTGAGGGALAGGGLGQLQDAQAQDILQQQQLEAAAGGEGGQLLR